jgi:hypothetical protein
MVSFENLSLRTQRWFIISGLVLATASYLLFWGRIRSDASLETELSTISRLKGLGIASCVQGKLIIRLFDGEIIRIAGEAFEVGGPVRIREGKTIIRSHGSTLFVMTLDGGKSDTHEGLSASAIDLSEDGKLAAFWGHLGSMEDFGFHLFSLSDHSPGACSEVFNPIRPVNEPWRNALSGYSVSWINGLSAFLISDGHSIYRLEVSNCSKQYIGSGNSAVMAPSGAVVAYRDPKNRLTVATISANALTTVWQDDRDVLGQARWSPDSRFLVYAVLERNVVPRSRILVREVCSRREVALPPLSAGPPFPSVSDDNGYDFVVLK